LNASIALPAGENSSKAERPSHSSLENGVDGTSLLLTKAAPATDLRVAVTAQSKRKTALEKTSNDFGGNSIPPVRTAPSDEPPLDMVRSKDGALSVIVTPHQTEPVKEMPATVEANTFQRLDTGPVQVTLLHSNAHQIAVGMHDPSLGWLEVQAQSSAGHVSAIVTANSMEAHASLTAQAPSITQYLADRDLPLHSLNVLTQSDMHSGTSGNGQPQQELGNSRQEMSESGVAAGVGKSIVLNDASHVSSKQVSHASYISVHV